MASPCRDAFSFLFLAPYEFVPTLIADKAETEEVEISLSLSLSIYFRPTNGNISVRYQAVAEACWPRQPNAPAGSFFYFFQRRFLFSPFFSISLFIFFSSFLFLLATIAISNWFPDLFRTAHATHARHFHFILQPFFKIYFGFSAKTRFPVGLINTWLTPSFFFEENTKKLRNGFDFKYEWILTIEILMKPWNRKLDKQPEVWWSINETKNIQNTSETKSFRQTSPHPLANTWLNEYWEVKNVRPNNRKVKSRKNKNNNETRYQRVKKTLKSRSTSPIFHDIQENSIEIDLTPVITSNILWNPFKPSNTN